MKTKLFITGSSGFIGFHVAKRYLDKGFKVYGFDSMNNYYDVKLKRSRLYILKKYKNFSFTKGYLENQKKLNSSINKFKPSIIIHLAAQAGVRYSIENPKIYLNSNIIGTFNVIECAKKLKIKHLIIGSSSSVYGANKKFPFQEIDKTDRQISFYAATKKSTESLAHSYSGLWKIPITVLRFFTVYGPWGRPDMALFKFTRKILNNEEIEIFNKGNMKRDFTYIDDLINGIISVLNLIPNNENNNLKLKNDSLSKSAPYRIINIGNANPTNLMKYISLIEEKLGIRAKKKFLDMQKGEVKDTWSDISLIKNLNGFEPKTNISQGIENFVEWYRHYYKIDLI